METIKSQAHLVEVLFQELDEAKPRQDVDPSFIQRVGGICHALIYGGFEDNPPYLEDTFAILYGDRRPTRCGTKLVTFAQALAKEGWEDPTCRWTLSRLLHLMLDTLQTDDLQVRDDPNTGRRYVVSTKRFSKRRGLRVRVRMGRVSNSRPKGA